MTAQIIQYTAARRELELCVTLEDTKIALDKTAALAFYAKQNNDIDMEKWVAEIKIRARRKIGELSAGLEKSSGIRNDIEPLPTTGKRSKEDELKAVGISTSVANRCEKIAEVPEERFEEILSKTSKPITYSDIEKEVFGNAHVSNNSGENEWYTPARFINAAKSVMGDIDLDPASSDKANETVDADTYYTALDNGLSMDWNGRVWMNPPYAQPLIMMFSEKLVESLDDIESAIVLVNNATETKWFQLLANSASAICMINSRVRFLDPDGNLGAPLQGQALIYFGNDTVLFDNVFSEFGVVLFNV